MEPFIQFNDAEKSIVDLVQKNQLEEAAEIIGQLAMFAAHNNDFVGQQIYLPTLDAACSEIGEALSASEKRSLEESNFFEKVPFVVVTELHETGGHSRIVEDLVKLYPKAQVITTGYFPKKVSQTGILSQGIQSIDSLQLPADSVMNNALRLKRMLNARASMVFHLASHHDVVANIGLSMLEKIPVFFIHHSDHRPSLGCTIHRFIHVDIAKDIHETCSHFIGDSCVLIPQGVYDHGQKSFEYPLQSPVTATSGTPNKFVFTGPNSLPKIIASALTAGASRHFHVGPLANEHQAAIRAELKINQIDESRFTHKPVVASLWKFLLESPVNLFIGSAPLHGLRTSIEVQGAGIPFIPFKQISGGLLKDSAHYTEGLAYWSNVNELCLLITNTWHQHADQANKVRRHYESNFNLSHMKNAIDNHLVRWRVSQRSTPLA
jgi:hypothetical protein